MLTRCFFGTISGGCKLRNQGKLLVRVTVRIVIFSAVVFITDAGAQDVVSVANVEIRMVKSSTRGPLRVTAETRNPNDFAVRDVQMNCTIKSRDGKNLVSYRSTILSVFEANERKTTKNLSVGAWPPDGFAALCVSTGATRIPRATQNQ